MNAPRKWTTSVLLLVWLAASLVLSAEVPVETDALRERVQPFFEEHCIRCHGPDKSKGKVTLHNLDGELANAHELELWEKILDMLEKGEMPPEDEPQPKEEDRGVIAERIDKRLRDHFAKAEKIAMAPTARRLTNVEYENTMRDLLGFRLKFIDSLPKDPEKPYKFNNTAELMRMGPEQVDRYLDNARRAMASAIVDPVKPEPHQTRVEWKAHGVDRGLGGDELGVWGNRRNTPATGMGLRSFPMTGEYRIRIKASAILPSGITALPLRLVMGYSLDENSSTLQMEPVGTIRLRNDPDHPEVFEFRGRIENHPPRPGLMKDGVRLPDTMVITPQNLYDDGTLNDGQRDLSMPRAVVEWMEFEAPVVDIWPPEHHTRILFDSPLRESDPSAYIREVLQRFMTRAYRRPATSDEVDRLTKIHELIRPDMESFEAAMRETLAMVLISPQFLYHASGQQGAAHQFEIASQLSYFLWCTMPDDELIRLAGEGKLADAAVIEQQVRRMLADTRSRDFVENFTKQWLSIEKMKTVPINRDLFPRFLYYVSAGERAGTEVPYRPTIRDYMIGETVGFVAELIRRNASILNIVDSDFAWLNQPLAVHYGVPGVEGDEFRAVPITPEHQLGGLFTHGSVLIGNGTGSAPHPIYRAVWLREAILGDEVAPPPADVPALSDSAGASAETATTIKDLLALHRKHESCNDCHVRLDPWGIPFEQYNAIGKYQPRTVKGGTRVESFNKIKHQDLDGYAAYLASIHTVDVQADANLPHGPEVNGMIELKTYLLQERPDDVAKNVMSRLLEYAIARPLTFQDRLEVENLLEQAKKNDYKFQDVIVSICQSKTFFALQPHSTPAP